MDNPATYTAEPPSPAFAQRHDGVHRTLTMSIIIPALNEAEYITAALIPLQRWRDDGHEVIVVDGGSRDETVSLARPLADQILVSTRRGRAHQMNRGAQAARGDILLFLHADTLLPEPAPRNIIHAMTTLPKGWGFFGVRITGGGALLRLVAFLMTRRSRLTGIATGDQAIFVRRPLYEAVGGYPAIPLMEDIALTKRLKHIHRPVCLPDRVTTSGRRWERHGTLRTVLLMWRLRLAFFLGADPGRLAQRYDSG